MYRLHLPRAVVFDELHFASFIAHHLNRLFVFDIHPWLGKLTLALSAYLAGFPSDVLDFPIATPYPTHAYLAPRLVAALFGAACVPLMFLIARALGMAPISATLAAAFQLLDLLLLTESRLILVDSQLMCYIQLTLLCALRLWRLSHAPTVWKKRTPPPAYFRYLALTAVFAAAALSVKWTAAVTPFLVAVVCLFGLCFPREPTPLSHCALAAALALGCYALPWWLHLRLSTRSSPTATRMSDRFRTTLTGNASLPYDPSHNVTFSEKLLELHVRQFKTNRGIKTRHRWESKWYEWPLNMRGIYYYVDKAEGYTEDRPVVRVIYLLQNPASALWVAAAVALFALLLPCVLRYRNRISEKHSMHRVVSVGCFLLAGYVLNLVPYMFVERCSFLYHYLPALMYGQLLAALLIDALPRRVRVSLTVVIIATLVAAFVFWAPWVYAWPIDGDAITRRQWMPRWN
ncbi:Dolichyl-phosphate-mannose--protein mannosyltransferase, family GT39 [Chondrus crispus]|uniref:Dolichyl-phosphate-mannose--protein mannosyltransferase, family GT39 n=1 Tax=Chondrus crispus TaxID=2769 RepID=R7QFC2_CHOCR|nr:Dolichyl-phosphate-mannose--protein mannosyltransferase, family GT39 [Chondrus crispus]CDF36110.1 Dolichyl-phosphate-mannose--protein mannosyltransferase, family GT39 [Chondrus crispus]|eukprot:XP_005715929.1 Dolichyl-phosphate-mannose--protein mannosyltransferase, family GT39 [Chondrus crispus]